MLPPFHGQENLNHVPDVLTTSCWHAFMQADSVFDVIPGDVCSSIILASAAAVSQV
jgi:hypothetical protein